MPSIETLARRLGGLAWISSELSTIEQRWAARLTNPAAVEHLSTHGRHHEWHATLWTNALPDSPALDRNRNIAPLSSHWAAAIALTKDDITTSDVHRLVTLYRGLLPRLLTELDEFSAALKGPGTGAIQRIVGLVIPDVAADLNGGHAHLVAILSDGDADEIAAACTKALDQAFRT